MGIFSDWASRYYESGLSVLPVDPKTKSCYIDKWTEKFSHNFPSELHQDEYIENYKDHDLGLATGEASGVIAIDFDYEMADCKVIESLVIGVLPPSTVIKKGSKGWTAFYKYTPEITNRGINRFGTRMIDVLTTGRLTVLPPSHHTKDGIVYKWLTPDTLLDIDVNDLNELTLKHIDQLEEIALLDNSIFNEVLKETEARHDIIVGFILKNSDVAKDLEELCQMTLNFDVNRFQSHEKGPYFQDKKYLKSGKPYDICKKLVERVVDYKKRRRLAQGITWEIGKYPKLHNEGKKASTVYEDFKSFFEFNWPNVRYDKIKKCAFFYEDNRRKWTPIENLLKVIESDASQLGLSPSYVDRHLQKWVSEMKPRLLIDIPHWDRKDRIAEMVSKLTFKNIDQLHAENLIKGFCANIFNRLQNPMNQNKMMIFKGDQGLGKDRWIAHLFGGFNDYFSEIEFQQRKTENYQTIASLLIGNIPEFDETNKIEISMIKSLITSPGATFRTPYSRQPEYVPFYISYVSSCNFDNILRDSSGNRRYMIFDVEKISWNYDDIDKRQLLAQCFALFKSKYVVPQDSVDAMDKIISDQTPDDLDDLILQDLDSMLCAIKKVRQLEPIRWRDISDHCSKIRQRYGVSMRRIQSIMARNRMTRRDVKSTLYNPIYLD